MLTADAVEWYVRRGGAARLCLFADTRIYWESGAKTRAWAPYSVMWSWPERPTLRRCRTPGIRPFRGPARQALSVSGRWRSGWSRPRWGTVGVYLVYRLTLQLVVPSGPDDDSAATAVAIPRCWTIPLIAAAMAALNPYYAFMSAILLSEAVFVPLMLAAPGRRCSGTSPGSRTGVSGWKACLVALGSGAAAGLAILVRPSWAPFLCRRC